MAYIVAVGRFFAWCEQHRIGQLADIEPLPVAAYIEALGLYWPVGPDPLATLGDSDTIPRNGISVAMSLDAGDRNWRQEFGISVAIIEPAQSRSHSKPLFLVFSIG
jgi:hypothetical protein